MKMGIDKIIRNVSYFTNSAIASVGWGLATREIIDGNYLSAIVIGATTSLPLYWASEALVHIRFIRESDARLREMKRTFHDELRSVAESYPDLGQKIRSEHPEAFR